MPTSPARILFAVAVSLSLVASAACGAGDDAVITDFGDVYAVAELDDRGDLQSRLLTSSDDHVLGALRWQANTGVVAMTVRDRTVAFAGHIAAMDNSLAAVNELLYAVYEVEDLGPGESDCVANALALCCLASSDWSCVAR